MPDQQPAADPDNGHEAFLTLGRFLEKDGWHPQRLEPETAYRAMCQGKNGVLPCAAIIMEELEQFVFYADAPFRVGEDRRAEVARFITLANYGMRIGNFEMAFRDGTVRYKSSLDFEGVILLPQMIRTAVYAAVRTMDEYLPGLTGIAEGTLSAEQAIRQIEG
jgi:hypothetical protein